MDIEIYNKALNLELPAGEMRKVMLLTWETKFKLKEDFYLPKLFLQVCNKKLNDEIEDRHFNDWLFIACNLLYQDIYYELAKCFGNICCIAEAKICKYTKKQVRELIAFIKDFDVKLKKKDKDITSCLKNKDYVEYYNDNKMKVIYYREEFCDAVSGIKFYKCYVVDHALKTYNYLIADENDILFDLSKNYCKIFDEEKHEHKLKDELWWNEYDEDTYPNPEKRFCEAELDLQKIFADEKYTLDKNLTL